MATPAQPAITLRISKQRVLLLVFLVAALIVGCGSNHDMSGGGQPPPVPALSTVAFSSNRSLDGGNAVSSGTNIWTVKSDGSGAVALTKSAASSSFDVAWSPDASKIAFRSNRALDGSDAVNTNNTYNIWVVNVDGSGSKPLTKLTASLANSFAPVWSPDGTKIAFASVRALDGADAANINSTSNIWVMKTDGSGATPLTRLTADSARSNNPAWSPDGSKLAFDSARALDGSDSANTGSPTANIWMMRPDGSGPTPLTMLTAFHADSVGPHWSPDGRKIAFTSSRALNGSNTQSSNANVWTMNADGSGAQPLTTLLDSLGSPGGAGAAWSPDGSKLALDSPRSLDGSNTITANRLTNIWTINADGSGARPVTTAMNALSINAAWSPDGSKIAFESLRALDGSDSSISVFNIWVINSDGSGLTALTKISASGAMSIFPKWHP